MYDPLNRQRVRVRVNLTPNPNPNAELANACGHLQ